MADHHLRENIMIIDELIAASAELTKRCQNIIPRILDSEPAVSHVYAPLEYASQVHLAYIRKFAGLGAKTLLLGLNPGPFGMGQTGIPFGATEIVRDFLGLQGFEVQRPDHTHPKRPVEGITFKRQEISGTRLWRGLEESMGTAKEIHRRVFLTNHCPLLFLEASGRNLTPDRLKGDSAAEMLAFCDEHVLRIMKILGIKAIIGVGRFAERRALELVAALEWEVDVRYLLHPSPQVPEANREGGRVWRTRLKETLKHAGVSL